jgi:hypothetical protein
MKIKTSFRAALLAALAPLALQSAAPARAGIAPDWNVSAALSQISVYGDGLLQNYHESDAINGASDHENGVLPGASIEIGSMVPPLRGFPNLYLGGGFQYNSGNVDYHGTNITATGLLNFQTRTRIENGTIEGGPAFLLSPRLIVIPLVYWGQRDWNRNIEPGIEGEDYRTNRIGAAVRAAFGLTPHLTAIGRVGVATTLSPQMTAQIEGYTFKFAQKSAVEAEAEAGFDYALTPQWHLRALMDIGGFTYGRSAVVDDAFYEPSSSTTDISAKIGIGWSF